MIETDDVLAKLGERKSHRWVVGFALEAQNERENAAAEITQKKLRCHRAQSTGRYWFPR